MRRSILAAISFLFAAVPVMAGELGKTGSVVGGRAPGKTKASGPGYAGFGSTQGGREVHIRSGPEATAAIEATATKPVIVRILSSGSTPEWVKVLFAQGRTGFIHRSELSILNPDKTGDPDFRSSLHPNRFEVRRLAAIQMAASQYVADAQSAAKSRGKNAAIWTRHGGFYGLGLGKQIACKFWNTFVHEHNTQAAMRTADRLARGFYFKSLLMFRPATDLASGGHPSFVFQSLDGQPAGPGRRKSEFTQSWRFTPVVTWDGSGSGTLQRLQTEPVDLELDGTTVRNIPLARYRGHGGGKAQLAGFSGNQFLFEREPSAFWGWHKCGPPTANARIFRVLNEIIEAQIGIQPGLTIVPARQLLPSKDGTLPWIGITEAEDLTSDDRTRFGLADGGVKVADVDEYSPAAEAGIEFGDVITALNGNKITDAAALRRSVQRAKPGLQITLTVVKDHTEPLRKLMITPDTKYRRIESVLAEALAGNAVSASRLAEILATGWGVERNLAESVAWFRKSAALGHNEALLALAKEYHERAYHSEAAVWFEKSAAGGNRTAKYHLGLYLHRGQGIGRDRSKSADLFRDVVDGLGDSPYPDYNRQRAALLLSEMFLTGDGVPPDFEQAVTLLQKLHAAENEDGSIRLASIFEQGLGTRIDHRASAKIIVEAIARNAYSPTDALVKRITPWSRAFWRALQSDLRAAGFYESAIDGRPNNATLKAIAALRNASR